MRKLRSLWVVAVFWWGAASALAAVQNLNPNATISIIGTDAVLLTTPAQVFHEGFTVRLVNPQGQPMPGLVVEFFVNQVFVITGSPPPPPLGTYGRFPGGRVSVTTDADGIARSGPFIGGTLQGSYRVAATLSVALEPANAILVSPPGPRAFWEVVQRFEVVPVPLDSPASLLALAVLILLVAWGHAKRRPA